LYSDNLKLSVEAKITSFHFIFTCNQAKVGLIFHSAEEKRVLSIDFFIIFPEIFKLISSLIFGIKGNSEDSIHFIFNFQLEVDIFNIELFNNSISISSSCTKDI
jgi:hypothetical protein